MINAMTRAADREIPALPCTNTRPPCLNSDSMKAFTSRKCGIIFW